MKKLFAFGIGLMVTGVGLGVAMHWAWLLIALVGLVLIGVAVRLTLMGRGDGGLKSIPIPHFRKKPNSLSTVKLFDRDEEEEEEEEKKKKKILLFKRIGGVLLLLGTWIWLINPPMWAVLTALVLFAVLIWQIGQTSGVAHPTPDQQYPGLAIIEGSSMSSWLCIIISVTLLVRAVMWFWGGSLKNLFEEAELQIDYQKLTKLMEWGFPIINSIITLWIGVIGWWLLKTFCWLEVKDAYEATVLVNKATGSLRKLTTGSWPKLPWEIPTSDGQMHMGRESITIKHVFSLSGGGTIKFEALVPYYRRWKDLQDVVRLTKEYIEKRITGCVIELAGQHIQEKTIREAQTEIVQIRDEILKEWNGDEHHSDLERELGVEIGKIQITIQATEETQQILNKQLASSVLSSSAQAIKDVGDTRAVELALADQGKMQLSRNTNEVKIEGADGAGRLAGLVLGTVGAVADKLSGKKEGGKK